MKFKVSEAIGPVLDWMVAKCERTLGYYVQPNERRGTTKWEVIPQTRRYSSNWSQGGPIMDREKIDTHYDIAWFASKAGSYGDGLYGSTKLEAAMRCYVASKLGYEVEVPEELLS